MKKYYAVTFVILFILLFSSCISFNSGKEILYIEDNYFEIILNNKKTEKFVYQLYLNINVKIEGKITIIWSDGNGFKRQIIMEDNDKYLYNSDYYADIIILKIYPEYNSSGKINIRYRFYLL